MEPRGRFGFSELLDKWDDIREKMRGLLEKIESGVQADMVYQHPYAGALNIAQTMEFMEVQFDNHVRHIDVILARLNGYKLLGSCRLDIGTKNFFHHIIVIHNITAGIEL